MAKITVGGKCDPAFALYCIYTQIYQTWKVMRSWDFEKPAVLSIELEELIDVESFSAKPIGPISENIPDEFHQLIPQSFASSYVVNSYEDSAKLRELLSLYKQPQHVYHYQDDLSIANDSCQNNLVVKKL